MLKRRSKALVRRGELWLRSDISNCGVCMYWVVVSECLELRDEDVLVSRTGGICSICLLV